MEHEIDIQVMHRKPHASYTHTHPHNHIHIHIHIVSSGDHIVLKFLRLDAAFEHNVHLLIRSSFPVLGSRLACLFHRNSCITHNSGTLK